MKIPRPTWIRASLLLGALFCLGASSAMYRLAHSGFQMAMTGSYFRFFVDVYDEGAEAVPADQVLNDRFMSLVFGDDPQLLRELNSRLAYGDRSAARLQMDKISALLVTHQYDQNDDVTQMAVRMFGENSLRQHLPSFHRDGYFRYMLDKDLWNAGNTMVGMLGRDIDLRTERQYADFQRELTESMLTGDLRYLLAAIRDDHHFTLAIPSPRSLLPPELRSLVQTIVVRGKMSPSGGRVRVNLYCANPRSARYTENLLADMKEAGEAVLRSRFGGQVEETAWGPQVDTWWAHEMVVTSEETRISREQESLVVLESSFGRVMMNVMLKSSERMGRDLLRMKKTFEQKLDPRIADAEMRSRQPSHYWTDAHRWGPNWPVPPGPLSEFDQVLTSMGAPIGTSSNAIQAVVAQRSTVPPGT